MGNICNNGNHQKEQTTQTVDTFNKNYPLCQFTISKLCKLSLVLGTYRYHRSQTFLLITQSDYLQYCPQLREYAQNYSSIVEQINVERKKFIFVNTNKSCPYKKLQICILPNYNSNQSESYLQQFQSTIQQVLLHSSDITFQLSYTSQNSNGLPNQTLMAVFLRFISNAIRKPLKVTIISSEAKLLNMIRYEVTKLENYTLNLMSTDIQM